MKPIIDRPIPESTMILDLETLPGDAVVGMDLDHAPGWAPLMISRSLASHFASARFFSRSYEYGV